MGTWDTPLNGNTTALDGYLGGVQIISVSSSPVTLTAPSGTVTAGSGPTQAQNAILRFSGALTSGVTVTLPLPGSYIIENLTTGGHALTFAAANTGNVISVDQGEDIRIYNDGTNVKFVGLNRIGAIEIWAGLSAMPLWVQGCTVPPYLLCDGTVYNFSTYPYLGARLGGAFGGNGITTFGVPDLRGRVPLPYDGTGTRITSAVSGINGQTLGASADNQGITLTASQIPTITSTVTVNPSSAWSGGGTNSFNVAGGAGSNLLVNPSSINTSGTSISNNTGGQIHGNVQPSQVTGIAVIRAA